MIINELVNSYGKNNCFFDLTIISPVKDEKRNFSRFQREFTAGKLLYFDDRQILAHAQKALAQSIVRRKLA
jgi:hypothetical protein